LQPLVALLIGLTATVIFHCRKRRRELRIVTDAHSTHQSADGNVVATSMFENPLLFPLSPSFNGHINKDNSNHYETIKETCLDTYAVPAELFSQLMPEGPYLIPSTAQRTSDRPWDSAYELERKAGASVKPSTTTSTEEGAVYSLAFSQPTYESVLCLQHHGSMARDENA
jgi:hypothetical protein